MPRILKLALSLKLLGEFQTIIKGFADSLIISKMLLKTTHTKGKKCFVSALIREYLPEEDTEVLHNATDDVRILQKLLSVIGCTNEIIKKYSKTIEGYKF